MNLRLKDAASGLLLGPEEAEGDPGSGSSVRQSRGVCESGVFNASCSLLLRFLYTGSVRSDRQAKIHGKNLLCLSKVV